MRRNAAAIRKQYACDRFALKQKICRLTLNDREIWLSSNLALYRLAVNLAVSLGSRALYRWTFPTVQKTKLNTRRIRDAPHDTVQSVNLSYEVPFSQPPNRWVARHHTDRRVCQRNKRRARAHSRRRVRRVSASVTAANNDDIKMFHVKHSAIYPGRSSRIFRPKRSRYQLVLPENQGRAQHFATLLRQDPGRPPASSA